LYLYAINKIFVKKSLTRILFFLLFLSPLIGFGQQAEQSKPSKEQIPQPTPLLQLSAGIVYSSIDLSRYTGSVAYRGLQARIVTHIKGMFYLSTEYSTFPVHDSPSAWENVHTRKFDINGHASFCTNNNRTHIFVLAGANDHQWTATRTGSTDVNQLGRGITQGTIVNINRWGMNLGCGFNQNLYENISVFGDCRFCFSTANSFEKIRILDVMTTFGVNYSISQPEKKKGKKNYSGGGKIYKWTKKGAH
jgi:hypothetical protein